MKRYETQTLSLGMRDLRAGDVWRGHRIERIQYGTKYAHLFFTEGTCTPQKLYLGTTLMVSRSVETEASQKERWAKAFERRLSEELEAFEPHVPKVLAKMTGSRLVDRWDVEHLVNAQAYDTIQNRWVTATRTAGPGELTDRLRTLCAVFSREIVDYAAYGNARSTSAVHNVVEAAQAAAKASFINRYSEDLEELA